MAIHRAGYVCERCKMARRRLDVHHKVHLAQGGSKYDPENLMVLCFRCHIEEHRHDVKNGVRKPWSKKPWEIRSKDPKRNEWLRRIGVLGDG